MPQPGEITELLQQADEGSADAANRLFVLVEADLKMIARKRKRGAAADAGLCTTEMVNDVFLRLVGQDVTAWLPGDRRKFFGYASTKMHDLLIKNLRAQSTAKRGGGRQRVDEDEGLEAATEHGVDNLQLLLDLKSALQKFAAFAPDDALLFRVRYFLDSTFEEAAGILGMSVTEAKRAFQRARLWLQNELKEYNLDA